MTSKNYPTRTPQPISLFLVRHGHSVTNQNMENHKIIANPAVPLTATGHQQAHRMAEFMCTHLRKNFPGERVHVWISPFMRTRQTAHHLIYCLKQAGVEVHFTERAGLVELLHGDFDALNDQERAELYPFHMSEKEKWTQQGGRFYFRYPNGESSLNLETRIEPVLDAIHREHNEHGTSVHVVVGHGWTNRIIARRWMNYSIPWVEKVDNPANTSVRCIKAMQDLGYIFGGFRDGTLNLEEPSMDPEIEHPYDYSKPPVWHEVEA